MRIDEAIQENDLALFFKLAQREDTISGLNKKIEDNEIRINFSSQESGFTLLGGERDIRFIQYMIAKKIITEQGLPEQMEQTEQGLPENSSEKPFTAALSKSIIFSFSNGSLQQNSEKNSEKSNSPGKGNSLEEETINNSLGV